MLAPICLCEAGVREAKGWIVGDNFLADLYRPVKLTGGRVNPLLALSNDGRQRIELAGTVDFIDRLLLPATDGGEVLAEPLMGGGVAGIQLKGFSELGFAAGKIPTIFHLVGSQVRMWACECGIEFQRFFGRSIRVGVRVLGV